MNNYIVKVKLYGHYDVEDPRSDMYGSGVDVKEVKERLTVEFDIVAESEARAREIVLNWDYDHDTRNEYIITLDEAPFIFKVTSEATDADEEEVWDVTYYDY